MPRCSRNVLITKQLASQDRGTPRYRSDESPCSILVIVGAASGSISIARKKLRSLISCWMDKLNIAVLSPALNRFVVGIAPAKRLVLRLWQSKLFLSAWPMDVVTLPFPCLWVE